MIKHVTIDLWLTLIRSHSSYKTERYQRVHTLLNQEIGYKGQYKLLEGTINDVDRFHTSLCEKTGLHNMSLRDIWYMVIYRLELMHRVDLKLVGLIIDQCNDLFAEYPPVLIDPNTVEILKEINDMGIQIDIISNTGFITGTTLRRTLLNNTFRNVIRAMFFSDAMIFAKPNPGFFKKSLDSMILNGMKDLKPEEILHIGDSPTADQAGALAAGFKSILINGETPLTLADIPKYIKQLNR